MKNTKKMKEKKSIKKMKKMEEDNKNTPQEAACLMQFYELWTQTPLFGTSTSKEITLARKELGSKNIHKGSQVNFEQDVSLTRKFFDVVAAGSPLSMNMKKMEKIKRLCTSLIV